MPSSCDMDNRDGWMLLYEFLDKLIPVGTVHASLHPGLPPALVPGWTWRHLAGDWWIREK